MIPNKIILIPSFLISDGIEQGEFIDKEKASKLFDVNLNPKKLAIQIGKIKVIENGKICPSYNEQDAANYMKEKAIDLSVNLNLGKKEFTSYTMDLTKKYIEINADYRT